MKHVIPYIKDNLQTVYTILIFIFSAIILIYIYPKGGKFQYEYKQGRPWMHENLIAPFDFPVYKTEKEIKQERDSITENFSPYYRYNEAIVEKQLNKFNNKFPEIWDRKRAVQDSSIRNNAFVQELYKDNNNKWYKENYRKKLSKLLEHVYNKGIMEFVPYEDEKRQGNAIKILKENTAQKYFYDQIFTLKTAYKYIFKKLRDQTIYDNDKIAGDEIKFIKELNLNSYLQPNLYYDAETTKKAKQNLLDEISKTSGMVQKGERIIFRGEVVTNEKLKILNSLKKQYEASMTNPSTKHWIILGHAIFLSFLMFTLLLFMYTFRRDIIEYAGKTLFILIMVLLFTGISIFSLNISDISLHVIPYAILPIIIRIFYDTRLALFVHFITLLIVGFLAPNGFEFILLQFSAGIIAIISLKVLTKRSQLFITAAYIFLTYSSLHLGMELLQNGELSSIDYDTFSYFALNGLLLLFTYPLVYIIEKSFGFLSDVTLIELSDANNDLLRELAEKAPGTFQHSLQVGNLAEAAIQKIGGNPLLVRTGALYHDIGKMEIPQYFIENQGIEVNPHDELEYHKSAEIIISHVARGVKKAHKHSLPPQIIDFIKTHHGTNKVMYFYNSYKNKYPDAKIDISKFTYPGPKPFSRETAILMMADSVEAASRSLKVINEKTINDLVENIINNQIENKQFNNADITFKDISTTKRLFKKKMNNIFHARIEYPEETKKRKAQKA